MDTVQDALLHWTWLYSDPHGLFVHIVIAMCSSQYPSKPYHKFTPQPCFLWVQPSLQDAS